MRLFVLAAFVAVAACSPLSGVDRAWDEPVSVERPFVPERCRPARPGYSAETGQLVVPPETCGPRR